MQTLKQLIAERSITAESEYLGEHSESYEGPYTKGTYWQDDWKTTLKYGRKRITVNFHMGKGHNGNEPDTYDVLYSLLSDAMGVDNARSFEDWASEYGYDTDSRKAEQTYKACQREAAKLRKFLGDEYQTFLSCELD